jgi:hypothetical protein
MAREKLYKKHYNSIMVERINTSKERLHTQRLLRQLLLERCQMEVNPTTKEDCWRAPDGWIFRMSGEFTTCSIENDPCAILKPQDSVWSLIRQNEDAFGGHLDKARGNFNKAVKLLVEDLDDFMGELEPPLFFEGKWIMLSGSKVLVKGPMEAWVDDGMTLDANRLTPNGYTKYPIFFDFEQGPVSWRQIYAEGSVDDYKVELVRYQEPKAEIEVPPPIDHSRLVLPNEHTNVYLDEYCDYLEELYHTKYSAEDRVAIMRERRIAGRLPFADDAAWDIILPSQLRKLKLPNRSRIEVAKNLDQALIKAKGHQKSDDF